MTIRTNHLKGAKLRAERPNADMRGFNVIAEVAGVARLVAEQIEGPTAEQAVENARMMPAVARAIKHLERDAAFRAMREAVR